MGVKGRRHRRQWWREPIRSTVLAVVLLAGCTNVGPEFETPDAPITLLCGDIPMFSGKMGRKGNVVAVCIEEKVKPEKTQG